MLLTVTLNADASAIRVAAATHLPCGLSLAPRQLLANQAAEEVLLENGPTALLGPQPQPPPRPLEGATEAALGGAGGTPATEATVGAARKQQQDAAGGQCAAAGQLELDHLHDVTIMPQEQDTNGGLKLQLMAASGLGPLHLLRRTDGLMQVGARCVLHCACWPWLMCLLCLGWQHCEAQQAFWTNCCCCCC